MTRLFLASLITVGLCAGCASTRWPWQRSEPVVGLEGEQTQESFEPIPASGLPLSPEQRFSDVPVPMDCRRDPERSFVYESSTLQIGRLVYFAKATVSELAQFYVTECPASGWKLEDVTEADGADLLFTKPGKRLTVSVRNIRSGPGRGRKLVIQLIPTQ